MTIGAVVKGKTSKLAFADYMAALFMTLWAVILDVTTFASNDHTSILIQTRAAE